MEVLQAHQTIGSDFVVDENVCMIGGMGFCRDKLQACEGKMRSAIQDKANVVSEKAAVDRQLKALQAQTGKLTKVILVACNKACRCYLHLQITVSKNVHHTTDCHYRLSCQVEVYELLKANLISCRAYTHVSGTA